MGATRRLLRYGARRRWGSDPTKGADPRERGVLRYGTALTVGAAMALVAGCGVVSGDSDTETVLIAADLELTGQGAELGIVYENALRLRVEQVNRAGLLGDRRLEIEIRDNRSDGATSADNLAQLAADPEVTAIITGGCDECALAAVDTLNGAGVPTISLAAAQEIVEPVEERPYLFQLAPTAADNARVIATELEKLEAETIAVVTTGDLYGQEAQERMLDENLLNRVGAEAVVVETVSADEEAVASAVAAITSYRPDTGGTVIDPVTGLPVPDQSEEQVGPDAVVIWAPEAIASRLAVALDGAGYEGDLLLDSSAAGELFLDRQAADALDGARMVFTETLVIDNVIASSPAKAARKTWFNDYTASQGTYHAHSSFAADAVQLIVEAINRFDSTDRESVRTALENTQIDGLSGPIRLRLETHSGIGQQALVTLVAQGDRWRFAAD